MQCASSNSDDTNSEAGVHEGLVEVFPLVLWHAAIFPGLTVENQVGGDNCSTDQDGSIEQALG